MWTVQKWTQKTNGLIKGFWKSDNNDRFNCRQTIELALIIYTVVKDIFLVGL